MKGLIVALVSMFTASAFADGFVCYSDNLKIQVFNEVEPSKGTRNAAVMVISDTEVQFGRKTIATFTSDDLTLGNESAVYTANVDSRFKGAARGGEYIAGTRLSELQYVILDIDFSYAQPVADGARLGGALILVKENGKTIRQGAGCQRYLKN